MDCKMRQIKTTLEQKVDLITTKARLGGYLIRQSNEE